MKHRTADLEGALLDAAAAVAEGWTFRGGYWWEPGATEQDGGLMLPDGTAASCLRHVMQYSTDWAHGGPLIEREQITVMHFEPGTTAGDEWEAYIGDVCPRRLDIEPADGEGPTALIAAMRAYVASKLGEEVELP